MERNSKTEKLKSKNPLIEHGAKVDEALTKAVQNALLEHKRADNAIAVGRDKKVLLIAPE